MLLEQGWLVGVCCVFLLYYDCCLDDEIFILLVVYNISLLSGEFGGLWIDVLFIGIIDLQVYFFFVEIVYLCVFVYCLICCDGEIVQYVFFDKCVWYVGVFQYQGCECCNDFFIGIEFEGIDMLVYIDVQY